MSDEKTTTPCTRVRDPEIDALLDELTDAIVEVQPQLPAWDDSSPFTDPLDDDEAAEVRTYDAEELMRRAEIDAKLALVAALLEPDPEEPEAA